MKYKCFCENNIWDLTKDEIHHMLRGNKRFSPEEFIKHYKIDPVTYCDWLRTKGFQLTKADRKMWMEYKEQQEKKNNADPKKNELSWDPLVFHEIPKVLICALYQVDFEIKDGKRYYDIEQFERAKEDAEAKLEQYRKILTATHDNTAYSKLKPIDLVAMRIFRGYNRQKFAKESLLSLEMIKEYESKGTKIPYYIEQLYKRILGVKDRHIIQLRDIMAGKSKEITDDREIPQLIKLKVWRRDKGKCKKCGSKKKLHYHHIKRFSEGGQHTEDNLVLLCASCHAEEHKGEKAYYMLKKMAKE